VKDSRATAREQDALRSARAQDSSLRSEQELPHASDSKRVLRPSGARASCTCANARGVLLVSAARSPAAERSEGVLHPRECAGVLLVSAASESYVWSVQ
jgi:hypothetical protein